MTNYEYYKDQISRITRLGLSFAVMKGGELCLCQNIECEDCKFNDPMDLGLCGDIILEWADEEYVDWPKVPVDTKIWVKHSSQDKWQLRYFAKYEDDMVYAWERGKTSLSAGGSVTGWNYAKLAEENDE